MASVCRALALLGGVAGLALATFTVIGAIGPPRSGLPALALILGPWLFLVLVPFLVLVRTPGASGRLLRWGVAIAAAAFLIRFVPAWLPSPHATASGGSAIEVASWNLELGEPDPEVVTATLRGIDARVLGLQELTARHAAAIEADDELRARYPSRILEPRDGSLGMGLLTDLRTVGEPLHLLDPPLIVQHALTDDGSPLALIVAHPLPGRIRAEGFPPIDYDPAPRDADIAALRAVVDPILASGEPIVLLGDFNTVDLEPAYATLSEGLVDAHRVAGGGPGYTWRPPRLDWLPFGILRIDYLFAGNGVRPAAIAADCTPRGTDHCLVTGTMRVP
jgi:endonuclease/exonuclease/phosphatase (EEP) superfamily protein YafD